MVCEKETVLSDFVRRSGMDAGADEAAELTLLLLILYDDDGCVDVSD